MTHTLEKKRRQTYKMIDHRSQMSQLELAKVSPTPVRTSHVSLPNCKERGKSNLTCPEREDH